MNSDENIKILEMINKNKYIKIHKNVRISLSSTNL